MFDVLQDMFLMVGICFPRPEFKKMSKVAKKGKRKFAPKVSGEQTMSDRTTDNPCLQIWCYICRKTLLI